jgi:hypothetical protein
MPSPNPMLRYEVLAAEYREILIGSGDPSDGSLTPADEPSFQATSAPWTGQLTVVDLCHQP